MRLIDADKFEVVYGIYKDIPFGFCDTFDDGVKYVLSKLDEEPEVELNENRDGIEIKPCPFCSSRGELVRERHFDKYGSVVRCPNCGLKSKWFSKDADEAIDLWNTRIGRNV